MGPRCHLLRISCGGTSVRSHHQSKLSESQCPSPALALCEPRMTLRLVLLRYPVGQAAAATHAHATLETLALASTSERLERMCRPPEWEATSLLARCLGYVSPSISTAAKSFVHALLERAPQARLGTRAGGGADEVEAHLWFRVADSGGLGASKPPEQFLTARRPYAHWEDEDNVSEVEYRGCERICRRGGEPSPDLASSSVGDAAATAAAVQYRKAGAHWVGAIESATWWGVGSKASTDNPQEIQCTHVAVHPDRTAMCDAVSRASPLELGDGACLL